MPRILKSFEDEWIDLRRQLLFSALIFHYLSTPPIIRHVDTSRKRSRLHDSRKEKAKVALTAVQTGRGRREGSRPVYAALSPSFTPLRRAKRGINYFLIINDSTEYRRRCGVYSRLYLNSVLGSCKL